MCFCGLQGLGVDHCVLIWCVMVLGASVVAEDFGGRSALSIAEDNKLDAVRQVLFSYI